ncbi:hypothetical protein K502DRAFT_341344 [Neoconidiobolus thromboides FSU 785]|nr:hypothetical protein K502DRAFT_341344 [Neoconidiobolus thromboides FSU 785]
MSTSSNTDNSTDNQFVAKAVIIGISLTFTVILILIATFFIVTYYRNKASKGRAAQEIVLSETNRTRRERRRNRIRLEPYCKFVADSDALIVVRKSVELAFPGFVNCSVKTSEPLPSSLISFYFEVEIFALENNVNLCCGFGSTRLSNSVMPGYGLNSVGYCSLDGQLYVNGSLDHYNPDLKYRQGDIIGCGYFPRNQTLIFTKNGEREMSIKFTASLLDENCFDLYPVIGSTGTCIVKANFGQHKFIFKEANRNAWGIGPSNAFDTNDLVSPPPSYELAKDSEQVPQPVSSGQTQQEMSYSSIITYEEGSSSRTLGYPSSRTVQPPSY